MSRRGGFLGEIAEDECWRLLGTRPFGRLAWKGAEGISVIPVNYEVQGRELLIRTTAYSTTAREIEHAEVALQIDQVDEGSREGWSVLVRGTARRVFGTMSTEGPPSWAEGVRSLQILITPVHVTGRSLRH